MEKTDYVIITGRPVGHDEAGRLALDLLDHDEERIADTWSRAEAIPVRQPTSPADQYDRLFFGSAGSRPDPPAWHGRTGRAGGAPVPAPGKQHAEQRGSPRRA